METNSLQVRGLLLTAVAPTAWGTTYIVTENFLPADRPLFAATMRALPAGLALLAFRRQLPRGDWWWKALVLGICNIGLFFPLIFLAAYQLPGGLAATLQAMSPLAVMAIAWPAIGERPGLRRVLAALVGLVGVALLVMHTGGHVSSLGLLAAAGSVLVSALGFVMVKRWPAPTDMLTVVSWQLVAGGLFLLPLGLMVEGAPPHVTVGNLLGFAWLASAGTAIAYLCWFRGLARMPAGAVSLVGLINPVVGTLLGVVFAGELFGGAQALGMLLVLGGVVAGQRLRSRPVPITTPAQAVGTTPEGTPVRRTVGQCVSKSPWSTLSGTCEATSSSMPTTSRPPARCSTS
ncbi:MAG: EamA family transporter [Actinomycetota bacterium]|nr:EamA family transporter [Actinomycetota bacterium]